MRIFVVKHEAISHPEDVGIVLEVQQILHDLDSVGLAAAMLLGLMYVMDLNYPAELKFTFKVLQKVVMEQDGNMLSKSPSTQKQTL